MTETNLQHNSAGNPPRWSYNPSAWSQRIPLIIIAMIGFFIAGYLSMYQLKWIDDVWEPFFGDGSRKILDSHISKILPVPDALLGAFSYLVDAVAGIIGGVRRWKTMPWIVVVFGLFVGPLGLISVLLVVLQPVMFSAWCTLCLVSAVCSVVMIGPAMDELLASLQYMKRSKKAGHSLWKTFWGNREIHQKVV